MKKVSTVCILMWFILAAVHAFGSKDTIDTPASTLDSWHETVDISGRKPGKHNIIVTVEDLAGNQAFGGPFNLYVDPESDLPVARITNPLNNMRVPGNLNIVGTCIDDDAVDYVEIILDNSETPVRAEGKDFWSYYLDTNGMTEGAHTIAVYGVDINGVKGKPFSVTWHLDRNRPETSVQNLTMGALVSKKFTLSGIVTDGNGIKTLAYSLDQGKTFTDLKLDYDKKEFIWKFSVDINTIGMPDGPTVCWFKATDGQGSQGIYTFLYFIDNTPPAVGFISPDPAEAVNGIFSVSGFATDVIGLQSLSWVHGKERGDFEVIKGNPYWVKEFDITGSKDKNFDIEIHAMDIAGNLTVSKQRILVNNDLDVPSLTFTSPAQGELVEGDVLVSGLAIDDDGIAEVWYSLNKSAAEKMDTQGAFGLRLAELPAGSYTVEAWPVDIHGVRGPSVFTTFTAKGSVPRVEIEPVGTPNAELHPEAGGALTAKIFSDAGLKALTWTMTGFEEKTVQIKEGVRDFPLTIAITPDFPWGLLTLEVTATDMYDRKTTSRLPFYITNVGIPRDAPPESSPDTLTVTKEVTIPASGKNPASSGNAVLSIERVLPEDRAFEQGMIVTLAGPGRPKAEQKSAQVRLALQSPLPVSAVNWNLSSGESGKASVQKNDDGSLFALVPLNPLMTPDWTVLTAVATLKDGTTLEVQGVFCVVRPQSEKGVFDEEGISWGSSVRSEDGKILLFDGASLTALFNGKNDRYAASVALEKAVSGLSVSLDSNGIVITGVADGEYPGVVLVVTDDKGGKYKGEPVTIVVDSALPELSVDTTARPYWLQNVLPVSGKATDGRGIAKVEYSLDSGLSWTALNGADFKANIDISALPDGKIDVIIRATDRAGRVSYDWRVFLKDTVAPLVEAVFPAPADVVNGETRIGFRLADSSPVVLGEYRAPGDRSAKDRSQYLPLELSSLTHTKVGTAEQPISDKMEFRFTDSAGNATSTSSWLFTVDAKADLPVVEIHLPEENEVIRKDFVISGVVYDDDQPAKVWYKIDNGPFTEVLIENSYSIPVALLSLTDNEHTITLYAEDIHGVRGEQVVRKIRVSLEEPKAAVQTPSFETTNKAVIDIKGVASDKNGIDRVEISLDNGNSFNLAEGTESWSYRFDTRVIEDGTHVVFIRVYDKYETIGLYSSLINIDNTAPSIRLELPLDGSRSGEMLFISGQTMDNIYLEQVRGKITNMDTRQPAVPQAYADMVFENELIISRGIDIKNLPEGFYNMEIRGYDRAGNITRVSRNFEVYRKPDRNRIEFLYPMNGESVQGMFNIYGRVVSEDPVASLALIVDEANIAVTELTPSGYFKFTVTPETMVDGPHKIVVNALLANDKIIQSEPHSVIYRAAGPWITIDNLIMGDFAIERPWLMGTAGYSLNEEEALALRSKETSKEEKRRIQAKTVEKVEISFDNGKTFIPTEAGKKWRYRLETGDLREGYHFMVVRATMKTGEVTVSRSIIQVDKTPPTIRLISPGEGGRYNNELVFSGLSSDDVQLDSVMLSLRPGDKSAYAIPAFIQGLYFDWHFWGATLYDIGVGLTFFDNNVKLQVQFGQFTDEQRAVFTDSTMRYGGNVFGLKLLANLLYLPMDYFFGPDFYWLSASAAIGANFSIFTETQSGQPQILSAILFQLEFPRVTMPKRKTFKTFSLYTEGQFWFIPTDIDSSEVSVDSVLPHITAGIRLNVF